MTKRFAKLLPTYTSIVPNPMLAQRLAMIRKTYGWLQPSAGTENTHKLGLGAMDDAGILNTAQVNNRGTSLILLDAMVSPPPQAHIIGDTDRQSLIKDPRSLIHLSRASSSIATRHEVLCSLSKTIPG